MKICAECSFKDLRSFSIDESMLDRYRKNDIYWNLLRTLKVTFYKCWIGLEKVTFIGI